MNSVKWSPDTCQCVLFYEWDPTKPADQRTHTFTKVEKVCQFHQGLTDSEIYTHVVDNNQRKNKLEGFILQNLTSALAQTDPESGVLVWKDGISFNWSFSGTTDSRVLTISISGVNLTNNQKNTIQNWCNTTFGTGKVILQ